MHSVTLQPENVGFCEPSGLILSEYFRPLPSLWIDRDFAATGKNLTSQQSVSRPDDEFPVS
jgi:hypothetical protein